MHNKEIKQKAAFTLMILTLIVAGIVYYEDFHGHRWGAFIWFGVLCVALGRLLYFFITKR